MVGILSAPVRIRQALMSPMIKQWEQAQAEQKIDHAAKDDSAEKAANLSALRIELAEAMGIPFAGMYLDLEQFLDYINPVMLVEEAIALSHPSSHLYIPIQIHLGPRLRVGRGAISNQFVEGLNSILAGLVTLSR